MRQRICCYLPMSIASLRVRDSGGVPALIDANAADRLRAEVLLDGGPTPTAKRREVAEAPRVVVMCIPVSRRENKAKS